MTQARSALSTIWLVTVWLLAAIAACTDEAPPTEGRWGRGIYVEQTWRIARAVNGHRVHVLRERISCTQCHQTSETELGPVNPGRCRACHEREAQIEHASAHARERFGSDAKADCTQCHAFTLDPALHPQALQKLDEPLPLPASGGTGGRASRERALETFTPGDCKRCHATAQGSLPEVRAHGTQNCLSCHRPHQDTSPKPAPCSDCHTEITTRHAATGKTEVETCTTCHQRQHAAALEARKTCAECHAQTPPIVPATALFRSEPGPGGSGEPRGHTECVGCHQPHAFQASGACRTCHAGQSVLGGGRIPAHNQCTSCHAPHNVKGAPESACANCHKDVHPDHPGRGGGPAPCITCHEAHPSGQALARAQGSTSAQSAKNCSSCHDFVSSDHGSHAGVACTQCHAPHRFRLELREHERCASCHEERVAEVQSNAGHQACQGCHQGLPHQTQGPRADCGSCHRDEQARALPAHATCTNCHEPHSGVQATPCSACHRTEHATAPAGHQTCTSCHEPHAGSLTQKDCRACHQNEAQSPHGALATGCASCHRPHGPRGVAAPPPCTSCHARGALPGLHAEPRHEPCTRCHGGHGEAPGLARDVCLTCHRDRQQHFPSAPRCASCHLFTKVR